MIAPYHLALVAAILLAAFVWIFWSVRRHPSLDGGDGLGLVVIPPPEPVRLHRIFWFLGVLTIYAVILKRR